VDPEEATGKARKVQAQPNAMASLLQGAAEVFRQKKEKAL
jgi:hypothetical protein